MRNEGGGISQIDQVVQINIEISHYSWGRSVAIGYPTYVTSHALRRESSSARHSTPHAGQASSQVNTSALWLSS